MRVRDLQQYLTKFTEGKNRLSGNAVSEARIYIKKGNFLEEVKRIEVHEHTIIGQPGARLVFKSQDERKLIIPEGLKKDY